MAVETWMVHAFCATIFCIGLVGILIRRNILVVLMCIELMLNAVNLTFVSFSKQLDHLGGQMSVFFIITVAAAESAVGLGLVIALFRTLRTVDTDQIQLLKE
ncbi:MAG: NADH-quinone oxidoreductase subunit NuoK [Bdellovibrionales bacterium]|nr:NADH-quinone oxidoreductase subunit NuoK [Bdellovibrionales bacterium]